MYAEKIKDTAENWTLTGAQSQESMRDEYTHGFEVGMKEHERIIQQEHHNIKSNAQMVVKKIYDDLKRDFKLRVNGMKFRIDGFSSFSVLFLVNEEDFLSDEIEKVYEYLNNQRTATTVFKLAFIITPITKHFNESATISDGFTISYVERS